MSCISCGRGITDECECEAGSLKLGTPASQFTRAFKDNDDLKDRESTGRKRAAQLHPLNRESWCEWKDLDNCGGGKHPILGCSSGKQQNIHHGPDKDTVNNSPDNIHKICSNCHNRWHAKNDGDHDKTIPHSPKPATYLQRMQRLIEEEGPKPK